MFKMSYKTIHFFKYRVIDSINHALRDNIKFPRSDAGLQTLASGFAGIGGGMGRAIPGVVAAVDSVCFQRRAPTARMQENDDGTATFTPHLLPQLGKPTIEKGTLLQQSSLLLIHNCGFFPFQCRATRLPTIALCSPHPRWAK